MALISKYKLSNYPCLYYLSTRKSPEEQRKFLCGLGGIFGLDGASISAASKIFAHGSKGVLYNGFGYEEDEINKDLEKIEPFTDCKTLCNWSLVKKTDIKQQCCTVCPLSTTYLNARIDSERTCLRYTLHTGKISVLESSRYVSVVPIASDNDISVYPLITLYYYLNEFLINNEQSGPYDKDTLCKSFGEYLCSILPFNKNKASEDAIVDCVNRELNFLFNYDLAAITENDVNTCSMPLMSSYTYTPPKIARPDKIEKVPEASTVNSTIGKKRAKPSVEKALVDSKEKSSVEIPIKSPEQKEEILVITEKIDDVDKEKNENGMSESLNYYDTMYTNYDNNVYQEQSDSPSSSNVICNESGNAIFYPYYKVSTEFASIIGNCADDDTETILKFIVDICSSHFICVESIMMRDRPGLLFMMPQSDKFYYFDLEYASAGLLYPALSDAKYVRFLSLSPLPVISMLRKLGFNSVRVESLLSLYCICESVNDVQDYGVLFNKVLSVPKDDHIDFYRYYMPYYVSLYKALDNKLETLALKEQYKDILHFENVLGVNYDLSDILYGLSIGIDGKGKFDYSFKYNKDIPFIRAGIMHVLNIPALKNLSREKVMNFLELVSIGVNRSPYRCVQASNLLSFTDTGIIYYSKEDADIFLDIVLNVVRKLYKKLYNDLPIIKTYRVEYR